MAEVKIVVEEENPQIEDALEEVLEEALEEEIEEVGEAIAVAAIEAEERVAVAEIEANVELARIEADREREGDVWTNMNRLEEELRQTREELALLRANPPAPLSSPLEETVAELIVEDLTPLSMSAPTNETETEAIQESVEEKPEEPLIPPVVEIEGEAKRRTIRLV